MAKLQHKKDKGVDKQNSIWDLWDIFIWYNIDVIKEKDLIKEKEKEIRTKHTVLKDNRYNFSKIDETH